MAFSRSPAYYAALLKSRGIDPIAFDTWFQIFDCYSDPLGWKHRLKESGAISNCPESSNEVTVCRDVRNLDKLLSGVLELGKGLVGQGKNRFCIAIDSVTEMLRDVPLSSVAGLLSSIRSHEQVSSTFWSMLSDVHDTSTVAALEYLSSIVASVEGVSQLKSALLGSSDGLPLLEQNARKSRFRVRFKRRNGRVRLMSEDIHVEKSGITFMPVSSDDESMAQTLVPKVQFNLQLSEKEQMDRSKVVLPFEHQEKDRAKQIYDGRRSLMDGQNETAVEPEKSPVTDNSGVGEIVYFRDSDDERPDSDEDPDDDLDI